MEVKKELEKNIFLLTNFLNEGDKQVESKSQNFQIKQSNLENFKFNPQTLPINNGDLLQWVGEGEMTSQGNKNFTKSKKVL